MRLLQVDTGKTTRLFWGLLVVVAVVLVFTSKQTDLGVSAAAAVLTIVSMLPFYVWLLGWSHGLPLWPVFCLANGVGYAMAMFQNPDTLAEFTPVEVTVGGMTAAAFVLLGTIIWVSLTSRAPTPPKRVVMVEDKKAISYLVAFLAIGVAFQLNKMGKWIPFPGNTEMVFRGIALSLSSMGLFVLSFYAGKGLVSAGVRWCLGLAGTFLILTGLSTLMLAQAAIPLVMIVLGFTFGANRVPWKIIIAAFMVVAILHPGKYAMRDKYWSGGAGALSLFGMPAFFSEWVGYGFSEVGGLSGVLSSEKRTEDSASSAFERAGSLHMLLKVQKMTPTQVPFLNGLTYEHVPRMLVPRFIDDQKGTSHVGNQMLSVNYGLVEIENVNTVSIGWGLIPEAYANFGYLGVGVLAFVLAGFYSFITRLTVAVPLTSLRFVIGLLVMVAATTSDTMGIFVSSQFQGIMAVTLASFVFMRKQPNPFATGEEHTIPQLEGAAPIGHAGRGAGSRRQGVGPWVGDGTTKRPKDEETAARGSQIASDPSALGTTPAGQLAADGGMVRNMVARLPIRSAAWMPPAMRKRIAKQQEVEQRLLKATQSGETVPQAAKQLAVPYQSYRRYRG